jgi:hypothetical protein
MVNPMSQRAALAIAYGEWYTKQVVKGYSPSVYDYTLFAHAFEAGWDALGDEEAL